MNFEVLAKEASTGESYAEARARLLEITLEIPKQALDATLALARETEPRHVAQRRSIAREMWLNMIASGYWDVVREACTDEEIVNYMGRELIFLIGKLDAAQVDEFLDSLDPSDSLAVQVGSEINQERLMRWHSSGASGLLLHEKARLAGLPIGWLPDELHPLEHDLRCQLMHSGDQRIPSRELEPRAENNQVVGTLREVLSQRSLFRDRRRVGRAIYSAHEPAISESNGKAEVASFGFQETRSRTSEGINYDCDAVALQPFHAVAKLFAVSPGAYSSSRNAWEARFAMGQALSAFVGAQQFPSRTSTGATFLSILERVPECEWFGFRPDPEWAYDVAWDVGLLCIDGPTALALVVTDTD